MNTRETCLGIIRLFLSQGFEPPAQLGRPGDPARGIPSGIEAGADDMADLLNAAGLTAAEARDAAGRYCIEPNATQFRKPWPDVGMLVARSCLGRASAALGTSSDAEVAFRDFCARMSFLGFRPDRDDEARHLDPKDPARNDAMFAALAAVGGSRAWGLAPNAAANPIDFGVRQRAWTARYVEVRRGQAADPAIVRSITTQPTGLVLRG